MILTVSFFLELLKNTLTINYNSNPLKQKNNRARKCYDLFLSIFEA